MAVATLQEAYCELCKSTYSRKRPDRMGRFCGKSCSSKSRPTPKFFENATFEQKVERWTVFFEKKVLRTKDGCWDWLGSLNDGYGMMSMGTSHNGKSRAVTAHRVSWMINKGEIPQGLIVRHSCDNRSCTKPEHLILGTHKDNCDDKYNRKRDNHARGELAGGSKLTVNKVLRIRELFKQGINYKKIAKMFDISWPVVYKIKNKRTWRHV